MRLISLWVSEYKNLKDVQIDFDYDAMPIAIIGKNGTGKSNLIEVILTIFIKLYFGEKPNFNFRLIYKVHGQHVDIYHNKSTLEFVINVNGGSFSRSLFKSVAQSRSDDAPFPDMILGYYSGTCLRLNNLFKRYERSYLNKLRSQYEDFERSFFLSKLEYADFILLALISQGKFEFLKNISIEGVDNLEITLRPDENYNMDSEDPKFWGTSGALRYFLADLDNAALDQVSRTSETSDGNYSFEYSRKYIFKQKHFEKVGHISAERGTNVASMLLALKQKNMLISLNYTMIHTDNRTRLSFNDLSEGEKQLISGIGGLCLADKPECLILLDEPDTHLNPEWTWKYNSILDDALSSEQRDNSTVLIVTHNPIMISGLLKEQVLIAMKDRVTGQLTYEQPVRDPRGQGVANVLTSEFFGLPSSLDEHTQELIDERLVLTYKPQKLTTQESSKLREINLKLEELGLSISFRDPDYKKFEESIYEKTSTE